MNLPKEICLEYLNYYKKEIESLLTETETFRQKYPNWEENLQVKTIHMNIEKHILFWEKQLQELEQ